MIPKSENQFSDKIMLNQKDKARVNAVESDSGRGLQKRTNGHHGLE
jgi:hypothetical protein